MHSNEIVMKRRKQMGLTQETLADQVGVSRQTIAMWETSRQFPSDNVAWITARFLKLDESQLMEQLRWDRLHQRVDVLERQYDATITIKPTKEAAQQMLYYQRNASQTLDNITLTVTRIYKSIYFFDDNPTGGHGVSVKGADKIHLWHKGDALLVYLLQKNPNAVMKLAHGKFYIEDNLGNQFQSGATGSTAIDESTEQIGILFTEYAPKATSFALRYDAVNGREDDCDALSFADVPIDGQGISKTFNGDVITYDGLHWHERDKRYYIHLTHNIAREVRHIGLAAITDDLGNQYGSATGGSWGDKDGVFFEHFKVEKPHPEATTISFKYLFARTVLAFELRNLPLPS